MNNELKVFTNTEFEGMYPVGTAAVIIAKDKHDAARLLSDQLSDAGMESNVGIEHMIEVNISESKAIILCNGDY